MTHHTDAERAKFEAMRAEFEAIFGPMPWGCTWTGRGYCATEYNAWNANSYSDKFDGWAAAWKAARHAPAAPVPQLDLSDAGLTAIYKQANNEVGKARPLTTDSIFKAMRSVAALAAAPQPPEAAPIDPQLIQAIQRAGFQLVKGALGYELMKMGKAYAQADHSEQGLNMAAASVQHLPADDTEGGEL